MKYIFAILIGATVFLIILILLAWFLFSMGVGSHEFDYRDEFKEVQINDAKIRVFQKGEGRDILFIHGTPGSIEDWNNQLDEFSPEYRVTAFDRLGHGYSSADNYNYRIEDNASLVKDLIHSLNLKNPLLVGHSYGGSTLAHLVSNDRQVSNDIVIIDSPLYEYKPSLIYKCLSLPIVGKGTALIAHYTIAKGQMETGIKKSLKMMSGPALEEVMNQRTNIWLQPKILYSKSKESVHYNDDLESVSEKYSSIKTKITLITGEENAGTFVKDARKFKNDLPSCDLKIIKNTGHYIQLEKPEKVNAIIRQILEQ